MKGRMRVLVAYASRAGSTGGIAAFIGERLKEYGVETEVFQVTAAGDLREYDAFIIGSALYQFHWLKEAREFVSENRAILAAKPAWIFSSGPTGTKTTDAKGRDLREASGPKEIGDLNEWISPRDHRVFFGAFFKDRLPGPLGWFARWVPKDQEGDFRDWGEIERWAAQIAESLVSPVTTGSRQVTLPSRVETESGDRT